VINTATDPGISLLSRLFAASSVVSNDNREWGNPSAYRAPLPPSDSPGLKFTSKWLPLSFVKTKRCQISGNTAIVRGIIVASGIVLLKGGAGSLSTYGERVPMIPREQYLAMQSLFYPQHFVKPWQLYVGDIHSIQIVG
jgi:hypothetical protein